MEHNPRKQEPEIGLVIPCYNEESVLPMLLKRLEGLLAAWSYPAWVLFVDDGSQDRTAELLAEACQRNERMACLKLSRNFGHQTAVSAGLMHARGDVVVVLDADLQDPPEVVPQMLAKWREGYDVVYGVRENRKESALLRGAYSLFYRILKRIANVDLPLDAGDFSLMDRRVVDRINELPEHNRFIRGLRGWVGFRQIGLPYSRDARQAGEPKYNLRRLLNLAMNGLVSFSSIPLQMASWMGALSSLLGFALMIWAAISGLIHGKTPPGWASLAVIILVFGGMQLIVLGIMGEYLSRIFDEVKRRPHFIVDRALGWAEEARSETVCR
ncbi:MAG: glycosyltransferase family 2 protein [Kiritimatiellia bacterium]|jgi:glycosyltransferase involved in cell wall biosynthesis